MESKSPFLSSDVRVVLRPSRNGIHTARIDPLKWRSAPLLTSGSGIHTAGIFPYILTHFRTYPRIFWDIAQRKYKSISMELKIPAECIPLLEVNSGAPLYYKGSIPAV